jgi:hypothetical protein
MSEKDVGEDLKTIFGGQFSEEDLGDESQEVCTEGEPGDD